MKREEKKVTQNPTANPFELVARESESEDMYERIVTPTKPRRIIGLPKKGKDKRLAQSWLKAGVMEGLELTPVQEGTPQGGVVSPLLATVALPGLETTVVQQLTRHTGSRTTHRKISPTVVR